MANPFTDEQVQENKDAIASPVKRVVAPDGRAFEYKGNDELIKGQNYMVNANRSAAGTRRRQTRLMSSKGF
jgi:hypothetical protein